MKKLLVFSPYYPPHVGGLESHSAQFNNEISRVGYAVTVFTPDLPQIPDTQNPEKATVEGGNTILVIRYPAFELIANYPIPKFWQFKFYQQIKQLKGERYDAVISRTRFFFSSLITMIFAKSLGIKWLHIEHGSDFPKLNNNIVNFIAWFCDHTLGWLVFRFADEVVCNSVASAEFASTLHCGRKYNIVFRGVNEAAISEVEKTDQARKYLAPNQVVISYLGRLISGKGVADILDALTCLSDLPLVLWLIGSGPEEVALRQMVTEKHLQEKVIFWGEKKFKEAIGLLKSSDIFINPSYTEGMPTAVIEASLCHLPIIATNVGGTREILKEVDEIVLFAPHDVETIANSIRKLSVDAELRKLMGENAFKAVTGKFDWSESVLKYKNILEAMMDGKKDTI
jgi:glycosyltransferase involved in cell wall biosynthesis